MEKERFSLLLLEPGEIYFEDFSVDLLENVKQIGSSSSRTATTKSNEILGRLKMCSKSLLFEPKSNLEMPLIKIPYKECLKMYRLENIKTMDLNILAVECQQYIEMLSGNILQPYKFKQEIRVFFFNFHYGKVDEYLPQLHQLHRASTLHAYEQNSMIATIVFSRHNRVKFNPLWLDNLYEEKIVDYQVEKINPLVVNPGRLLLTNSFIYFQPYNNIETYPVVKIRLKSIQSLIRRRFLLRHIGLEIKWCDTNTPTTPIPSTSLLVFNSNSSSNLPHDSNINLLYVSFRNESDRNTFYERTCEQNDLQIVEQIPESITLQWQNGLLSNYDYLLYLNSLADRTYQDLTQYPVFPWIVADYSSPELDLTDPKSFRDLTKPIGALNEERLARLKERCDEMSEPKFLYGSHYSAPGLVLFYLVRKVPKLMLCLQNGRFDHPDRMFNKVEDVWRNCMNNMADFKELIPEFYDPSRKGDFLLNKMKIIFGQRYDGSQVNNVALPKWAENSPELFVQKLREALESDYVSQNLHHWIDLIFGYKQKGEEALKANNLFYHLCYEGAVDLDLVKDLAQRHALEVQISEFGQIPKQLFTLPHVAKLPTINKLPPSITSIISEDENLRENSIIFTLESQFCSHKDEISSLCVDSQRNCFLTAGKDGTFKYYSTEERRQLRNVQISDMSLSAMQLTTNRLIIFGCWDNSIIVYNLDYGRVSTAIPAHDDAVSCLYYFCDENLLISGSWDCSVKIWKNFSTYSVIGYLSLEDKIQCLDARKSLSSANEYKIVIGCENGEILLWTICLDLQRDEKLFEMQDTKILLRHSNGVNDIKFCTNGSKIVTCGGGKIFNIVDIETGMIVFKKEMNNIVTCLCWIKNNTYLLMGDNLGKFYIWNMLSGNIIYEKQIHQDNISNIAFTNNSQIITTGKDSPDYCVKIWQTNL
uniref:Putative neutral sphingomyelinase n-smase activation associated factor n=1 Tax=Corethrella appendiculata TaxID=1370023 RepID=U5EY84_9DIPT